jgi:DNA-binding NtrC family response regulator
MTDGPIVVALFDSSPDTVDVLRIVLERVGFVVVSAYTYDLREGDVDVEAFIRQHQPRVIVYDVALPYDANWRLFEHFRALPILQGVRFVITSTNEAHVRKVAGDREEILEIVGKPYDLDRIVEAVKQAAQHQPARRPAPIPFTESKYDHYTGLNSQFSAAGVAEKPTPACRIINPD